MSGIGVGRVNMELYCQKTLILLDLSFLWRISYKAYDMLLGPFSRNMMGAWPCFQFHVGFQMSGLIMNQRCFVQNFIYIFRNMYKHFDGKLRGILVGSNQPKCNNFFCCINYFRICSAKLYPKLFRKIILVSVQ